MTLPAALRPFAGADIYLLDQILRGRIRAGMRVLDVGCGGGRNILPLQALGCTVSGLDRDEAALAQARSRCGDGVALRQGDVGELAPDAEGFDVVLVNAVFHFADDREHFHALVDACWRQLAGDGLFLARLSTRIALPEGVSPPGFSFLAEEADLVDCERRCRARRLDPLKTTLVERARTMTTWVLTPER